MKRLFCLAMVLALTSVCATGLASGFDILVQAIMTTEAPQEMSEEYYVQFTRNGELMSTNVMSCKAVRTFKDSPVEMYELNCKFETGNASMQLWFSAEQQVGEERYITYDELPTGFSMQILGNELEESFIVMGVDTYLNNLDGEEDYLRFTIVSMEETEEGMMIEASFDARLLDGEVIYTDGSFRALFQ